MTTEVAAHDVPLDEERAVVARLQAGDRAAFATLYGWYGVPLHRAILHRLPDPTLAEDVLRDAFRTVLEKIDTFTYSGRSIWFWLHRIAVNRAMDQHRRVRRDRELADRVGVEPGALFTEAPRPDRRIEAEETATEVHAALDLLTPRYREVIELRILQERSREECAELLGITLGNLDVLLHRACKAFRKVYPP
jgi:RNA polymerase sigma-70 factor (ECF subfamily)